MDSKALITSKGKKYGPPKTNFTCIAQLDSTFRHFYLQNSSRTIVSAVAMDGIIRKMARIATGVPCADNWKDIIGYAEIGLSQYDNDE